MQQWHPDPEIRRQRAEDEAFWRRQRTGDYPPGAWLAGIALPFVVLWICCASPLQSLFGDDEDPEDTVRAYVQATLADPDLTAASRLTCPGSIPDNPFGWQDDLNAIRQQYGADVLRVEITSYRDSESGAEATADVTITATMTSGGKDSARSSRSYRIDLSDLAGWKVCSTQPTG